jgi:hypothetical protein
MRPFEPLMTLKFPDYGGFTTYGLFVPLPGNTTRIMSNDDAHQMQIIANLPSRRDMDE